MGIKVLMADDHTVVRQALRKTIEHEDDFEVIAEAKSGLEAIDLAKKLRPDIILMDVSMTDLNGVEATYRIMAHNSEAKVLALSMHSDQGIVSEMLRAGAKGFLVKDCTTLEMVNAIRTVSEGNTYLSPSVAGQLVDVCVGRLPNEESLAYRLLSSRERQVLQLLAEGRSSKDIAKLLNIGLSTVESHRRQLKKKLNLDSFAGLVKFAIREGLTTL